MISPPVMKKFLATMALMKFFPAGEAAPEVLAEAIEEFIETDEQLEWLRQRVRKLYPEWPGEFEIRAAFCSKFRPKDGYSVSSTVFLDGIEKEQADQQKRIKAAPIPEGYYVTGDPELDRKVHGAAQQKALPPGKPVTGRRRL